MCAPLNVDKMIRRLLNVGTASERLTTQVIIVLELLGISGFSMTVYHLKHFINTVQAASSE